MRDSRQSSAYTAAVVLHGPKDYIGGLSEVSIQEYRSWVVRRRDSRATALTDALQVFEKRLAAGEGRLFLLKDYARILVDGTARYKNVRRARYKRPDCGGTCWACQKNTKRLVCHHIIQVQHGGRNVMRNLVWVCRVCHAEIHPWLVKNMGPVVPVFDATPRLVRPPE